MLTVTAHCRVPAARRAKGKGWQKKSCNMQIPHAAWCPTAGVCILRNKNLLVKKEQTRRKYNSVYQHRQDGFTPFSCRNTSSRSGKDKQKDVGSVQWGRLALWQLTACSVVPPAPSCAESQDLSLGNGMLHGTTVFQTTGSPGCAQAARLGSLLLVHTFPRRHHCLAAPRCACLRDGEIPGIISMGLVPE